VLDSAAGGLHVVDQPDPAYTAFPGSDPNYDSPVMRFYYTSLTDPFSAVDYDMRTRERTIVKEQPVRGGYDRRSLPQRLARRRSRGDWREIQNGERYVDHTPGQLAPPAVSSMAAPGPVPR